MRRHMRFIMRYEVWGNNMWGSDSAVQWGELKCCETWHCVSVCALSAFCWIWCLHCEGWAVQVESATLKTEGLQLLKMSTTAHTTTQHHMWHYIPADHNLDTKQVMLLTLLISWGLWVAELTNSIIDSLPFSTNKLPSWVEELLVNWKYASHITNKYLPLDDQGHAVYGISVHSCGHMAGGLHKDTNI
jgi:hypothetical protein